jgi:anti-anti-sigma factor
MGKILFAKQDDVRVLKFVGDVRVTLGPTISNFLDKIKTAKQLRSIIIDLTETTGIDSTTLGLLAKISLQSQKVLNAKPTLVSNNEDINRILSSMGFEQVFVIVHDLVTDCEELGELPTQMVSESALRQQVVEAHKVLMQLNTKNHSSFFDLVEALEKEQEREKVLEKQHKPTSKFENRKAS